MQDALAGLDVAVVNGDMDMGIMGVRAGLVNAGKPRHPLVAGEVVHEVPDELGALDLVKLARQGNPDLVDNAGILP